MSAASSSTATAQEGEERIAWVFRPVGPEDYQKEFVRNLTEKLTMEPRYVIGIEFLSMRDVHRVSDSLVEMRLQNQTTPEGTMHPRWTIQQPIARVDSSGNYMVAPEALQPGVEVVWRGSSVTLTAPPGGLPREGDNASSVAEALARRMGLPHASPEVWTVREAMPLAVNIYSDIAPHVPGFYLECDCIEAVRQGEGFSIGLNRIVVTLTRDGDPVAVKVTPWVDIAASRLIPPEDAARSAEAQLRAKGVMNGSLEFERMGIRYEDAQLNPLIRLTYELRPTVPAGSPISIAEVDAHTGELIATVGWGTPMVTPREPDPRGIAGLAPLTTVFVTSSAALLYAWGQRRRQTK